MRHARGSFHGKRTQASHPCCTAAAGVPASWERSMRCSLGRRSASAGVVRGNRKARRGTEEAQQRLVGRSSWGGWRVAGGSLWPGDDAMGGGGGGRTGGAGRCRRMMPCRWREAAGQGGGGGAGGSTGGGEGAGDNVERTLFNRCSRGAGVDPVQSSLAKSTT